MRLQFRLQKNHIENTCSKLQVFQFQNLNIAIEIFASQRLETHGKLNIKKTPELLLGVLQGVSVKYIFRKVPVKYIFHWIPREIRISLDLLEYVLQRVPV